MFKSKTVFVLGAGASAEFELPVGEGLAQKISEIVDIKIDEFAREQVGRGAVDLYSCLKNSKNIFDDSLQRAGWLIRDGILNTNSIDDFIERHSDNDLVVSYGKAAIVHAILDAESRSSLYVDRSNAYNRLDSGPILGTWLVKFFRMLGAGVHSSDLSNIFRNVSFIVFNYDRCLEHFLIETLSLTYGIPQERANELVANATIIHPYGAVGLSENTTVPTSRVPFGQKDHWQFRLDLVDGIKTYGENIQDDKPVNLVRSEIQTAKKIVFLGFHFHEPNMKLLSCDKRSLAKQVFATAYDMSPADIKVTREQIALLLAGGGEVRNKNIVIENMSCSEFFKAHSKSLPV